MTLAGSSMLRDQHLDLNFGLVFSHNEIRAATNVFMITLRISTHCLFLLNLEVQNPNAI